MAQQKNSNGGSAAMISYLMERFHLHELPIEGGVYYQSYLSAETIPAGVLPGRYTSDHPYATAIYFLLTPEANSFSALHRLQTDEVYHFYLGDPVEMLQLYPDGTSRCTLLGQDLRGGQEVQYTVPAHVWQGSHLLTGGAYALLGTTMAPGYIQQDFELGYRADLKQQYPEREALIRHLTRV